MNLNELKHKYAYTLAKVGLNVQPGQTVLVEAALEGCDFTPVFAEECYKLGAENVVISYLDSENLKVRARYVSSEKMGHADQAEQDFYRYYLERGACYVRLEGVNPLAMESVPETEANKVFAYTDAVRNIMRQASRKLHARWLIAMIPTKQWADYILPGRENNLEELWRILLKLCYIDEENDVVETWKELQAQRNKRGLAIDALHLQKLHYTAGNGTDLTVGLTPRSRFGHEGVPSDRPDMCPPSSYPAKLALFLHKRFAAGLPGLVIMPCELIENNAGTLQKILLQYAEDWGYEPEFSTWLLSSCSFVSTLVDRIVTGFPRDPELKAALTEKIGHEDALMDIIEPYHLLVLEPVSEDKAKAIQALKQILPFTEAGLNVVWTEDLTPYRTRKVRILNGAHTSTSLAARLAGLTTVEDFMKDPDFSAFLAKELHEEILPTIDLPAEELKSYTDAVMERFLNPYLNHQLSSIALNSVSKWKSRLLPTLKDITPEKAPCICFSLAALLARHRPLYTQDPRPDRLLGRRPDADPAAVHECRPLFLPDHECRRSRGAA